MHFTYKELDEKSDLQQGDLLHINEPLRAVLMEYHKYYATNKDYKFLIVLTQSCDLVRRKGDPCKSRYINVAAVKPAIKVLDKEFSYLWESDAEELLKLFSKKDKSTIRQYVESLLNNNKLDYFYLEPDTNIGFHDPMAAFLKLSIALRSDKHYDKCIENRFGQLESLFQAKLGWLVGNSYSRVGTPDWLPDKTKKEEWNDRIESFLRAYVWYDVGAIESLRVAEKQRREVTGDAASLSEGEGRDILKEFKKVKDSQQRNLAKTILNHVQEIVPSIATNEASKLQQRLSTADDVRKHLKK